MLWGNMAYRAQLSGGDLSPSWNKIESHGLRECLYYHYLPKKRCHNNKYFAELSPTYTTS